MDTSDQIKLMMRDIDDESSDLYQLVFRPLGMERGKFIEELTAGINKANEISFYGGCDTVYCGYTFIEGRQIYFKFSAPKEEMVKAVGSGAPFLEIYQGGVYLIELGPHILLKYAMPFYYKEFATYSKDYANETKVKRWGNFMVSTD